MPIGHKDTDGEFDRVKARRLSATREPQQETVGLSHSDNTEDITTTNTDRGLRVSPREEVRITETTIQSEYSGDLDIVIREYDPSNGTGELVDSTTVTLTTGVQTVDLDLVVPGDGDDYFFGVAEGVTLGYIDQFGEFPIEGDLLTIVEGATPEGFVGPRVDYHFLFDIGVEQTTPPEPSLSTTETGELEFKRITGDSVTAREVTVAGDLTTETTGLYYDEWSGNIDTYVATTAGPRLRPDAAEEIRITGATVDADSAGDTEVALKEINADDTHGSTVDTSPISVTEGRNEVEFDIVIPPTGGDYVLTVSDSNTIGFGTITSDAATIPYPIEGELLTVVNNSHPEGYAGPEGSYTRYFDIDVEEVTPATSAVRLNDSGEVQFEQATAEVHNGVAYPLPGELADAVAAAGDGDVVRLNPEYTYDPGEELTLSEGMTLDFNGAAIVPSSDHNVFFLENSVTVESALIHVGEGYQFTSDVFLCDTDRLGESYHGAQRGLSIDAKILGDTDDLTGTAFHVNVGASAWFSVQTDLRLKIDGFGNGIHLDVNGEGHANGSRIRAHLWSNRVNVRKSGGGNASIRIVGEMDATDSGGDSGTEYLLLNEGPPSARAITFEGFLWDSFNASEASIEGMFNIISHNRAHTELASDSPNAAGTMQWFDNDELAWLNLSSGQTWRMRWANDRWEFAYDPDGQRSFSNWLEYRPETDRVRSSAEFVSDGLWVTNGEIDFGSGAGIRKNSDGDIIVENENGDEVNLHNL